MRHLLAAIAIVLACVEFVGWMNPRMRISKIDDRRDFRVVVSDGGADDTYFWLVVEGCSADHTDYGVECNTRWFGRSDRAWGTDRKQETVPFRDAPKGVLLRFEALVMDRAGKHLASAAYLTTRSF